MKFSIFSTITLLGLSVGVLAAPTEVTRSVEKRAPIDDAYSLLSGLLSEIKTHTGAINETAESVSPTSSAEDKSAAVASAGKEITAITNAVTSVTTQVKAIQPAALAERQTAVTPEALALIVQEILVEISGALNNIIATLGLQALLGFLTPLVASLSALLLSLEVVVNNILALVQALVDGLLTGLSIGLAGIVL
ncbi:MAG: NEDD8-conjugating protein ubc12 [Chaenotheca gracillima]|nr:MAG: NEDD8-conjugating protein ubc12 [Chaenotheca gracillima]